MRVIAFLLGLVAVFAGISKLADAAGGGSTSPLYVRKWQGDTRDFKEVTCLQDTTTSLVTAAEMKNAMSLYLFNTDAAGQQTATICPRDAYSGSCDTAAEGISLPPQTGFTSDVSVVGAWSCNATGGTAVVEVYIERDIERDYNGTPLAATPTPQAPTPSPSPTPTPTPTP